MARVWNTLRFRLTLLVMLGVLPPILLILHMWSEQRQLASTQALLVARSVATDISNDQRVVIEMTRRMLADLAENPVIRDLDIPACKRMFETFFRNRPFLMYANIGIIDLQGTLVCSVIESATPVNMADRDFFQQTLRTGHFSIGRYRVGHFTGKKVISFGYPVLDAGGQLHAVIFAGLELEWFKDLAISTELPQGATLTLIDADGTILYRYPDQEMWVGRSAPEMEIVKSVLSKSEGMTEATGIDGIPKYYGFQMFGGKYRAGYVYVGIPKAAVVSQANEALVRNLIWLGISAATGLIVVWFIGYLFVVRPVNTLVNASERIAAGELGARTGLDKGSGEIGALGNAFDRMAQSLEERDAAREKSEKDLLREKTFTDTAIDSIPGMFYLLDRQGKFLRWNKNMERVSGYSADEISNMNALKLFEGDDKALVADRIMDVFTKGESSVEAYLVSKSGSEIPCYFTGKLLKLDDTECLVGMGIDTSELKRAEESLRESELKYRSLFEESVDGIYITKKDGTLIDANRSFLDLFGYQREESLGMSVLNYYVDPGDRQIVTEKLDNAGFIKDHFVKMRRKDGTEIDCLITGTRRLAKDGSIIGYRGIIRDITEHKSLEKQLVQAQKMEAVGTLAGGIAHDFNNMLAVIQGYSELLLLDKAEGTKEFKAISAIRNSAERGADLVRRILGFSRKLETNLRPIDLNHQVEHAQKLLSRTIPKMISIDIQLDEDLNTINADPVQIEQILLNLAVNAKHAIPEQGGRIIIETRNVILDETYCRTQAEMQPGEYVLLSVSDTGHGMDKYILEHLFEPFFTTKDVGEGTGLGLAMVYGIVQGHKGHIDCISEPGLGTTFNIYFPVIESEVKSDSESIEIMPTSGSETILLVDDEQLVRDFGKDVLSQSGYKVITAANGGDALDIYRERRIEISLVILDLAMPMMGGKECLAKLIEIDPEVKVIISSGYSAEAARSELALGGAKGFVGKPYNLNEMLQTVREVLDE